MKSKIRPLAFVIHDLNPWGGQDRSTLEIARRLSHRWPVEIYAFTFEDPAGREAWGNVRFHQIKPDVRTPNVVRLNWFYGATLPLTRLVPRLKGQPRPLVHATGTCTLASDVVQLQFVQAAWLEKQKEFSDDICARPFARGATAPKAWARKLYHEALDRYNVATEKVLYTPDKTYIAIAQCVADELRDHFGITKNVHVIHHGVDSRQFRPGNSSEEDLKNRLQLRADLGVAEDELAIAFVGAYERKGLATAIRSLARLNETARKRVKLLAIGGGAMEGFRALARSEGVEDRVLLLGHQKDIPAYYRASDIFLLPTLYEPFGLVIIEAMASGLACVVSRLAGASELLKDGESGLLIDEPSDADEVARKLERVVSDDALRAKMASESRRIARQRTWDRVADEYAQVLEPLMKERA